MKTIALVAHDRRKKDLIQYCLYNAELLSHYHLVCTGTTGTLIKEALNTEYPDLGLSIECKNSGPAGGDAQIASMIVEGRIDLLIFLEDDFSANPHQADIQMLERQARINNIFVACNRATADALLSSPLLYDSTYVHLKPQYEPFDREKFELEHKDDDSIQE